MDESLRRDVRFLKAYAAISSLLLVFIAAAGFRRPAEKQTFGEIDVERINLIEKDGKVRLVISNVERFPQPIVGGRTLQRQSPPMPGLLFYNDDGDENGGLVFGSRKTAGSTTAEAAILFDQYRQDQTVGIEYSEENGRRTAGFHVWDRPDGGLTQILDEITAANRLPEAEKQKVRQSMRDRGLMGAERVFVGKTPDRAATVTLRDVNGKARLVLSVDASGAPKIDFLDAQGTVVSSLPAAAR